MNLLRLNRRYHCQEREPVTRPNHHITLRRTNPHGTPPALPGCFSKNQATSLRYYPTGRNQPNGTFCKLKQLSQVGAPTQYHPIPGQKSSCSDLLLRWPPQQVPQKSPHEENSASAQNQDSPHVASKLDALTYFPTTIPFHAGYELGEDSSLVCFYLGSLGRDYARLIRYTYQQQYVGGILREVSQLHNQATEKDTRETAVAGWLECIISNLSWSSNHISTSN